MYKTKRCLMCKKVFRPTSGRQLRCKKCMSLWKKIRNKFDLENYRRRKGILPKSDFNETREERYHRKKYEKWRFGDRY